MGSVGIAGLEHKGLSLNELKSKDCRAGSWRFGRCMADGDRADSGKDEV